MEERFRRTAGRKVSHFIIGEEGRVGSKSAFAAAAVVSVASLTTMLLGIQKAHAEDGEWCPDPFPPLFGDYCTQYCCANGCSGTWVVGCSDWIGK